MSNQIRTIVKASIRKAAHIEKIRLRKDLNADALFVGFRGHVTYFYNDQGKDLKLHALSDALIHCTPGWPPKKKQ